MRSQLYFIIERKRNLRIGLIVQLKTMDELTDTAFPPQLHQVGPLSGKALVSGVHHMSSKSELPISQWLSDLWKNNKALSQVVSII